MLLLRLWNYMRGYVIILVEGYFLEKFINICIHRQIYLWDIKKLKNSTMTLKVSIKGFKLLRPIARKTSCRVRILHKRGLPFAVYRYKGRKAFVFGAFIFIAVFYVLTSFVWNIEVTGNKNIETEVIIEKLASYGVKPGALKYKINPDDIVNSIMMDMEELARVEVTLRGTKIKVQLKERLKPPSLIPEDEPCDIVARRDGLIKSIYTKKGQQIVSAGDTVIKGQVLISGTVLSKNENIPPRKVHSIGEVKARTWYEKEIPVEMNVLEKKRTGTYLNNYSLVLFARRFDLFHRIVPYKNYEKVEIRKKLSMGEDFILPFELIIDRFYENNIIKRRIDIEQAKKNAVEKANEELTEEIPPGAQILKTDIKMNEAENGYLSVTVTVECLEDIGVAKKIGGN